MTHQVIIAEAGGDITSRSRHRGRLLGLGGGWGGLGVLGHFLLLQGQEKKQQQKTKIIISSKRWKTSSARTTLESEGAWVWEIGVAGLPLFSAGRGSFLATASDLAFLLAEVTGT